LAVDAVADLVQAALPVLHQPTASGTGLVRGNRGDRGETGNAGEALQALVALHTLQPLSTLRPGRALRSDGALRALKASGARCTSGADGAGRSLRAGRAGESAQTLDRESNLPDLAVMARSLETDLAHDAGLLRNTKRSSERSLLVRCLTRRRDSGDHEQSDYPRK
jgi:hypothetical protein